MSPYAPGLEILPLAAVSSVCFYVVLRKILKLIPFHAAMLSVVVTLLIGWFGIALTNTYSSSDHWANIWSLVMFLVGAYILVPVELHMFHIFYIWFTGETMGKKFLDSDKRAESVRGKGIRARLSKGQETIMNEYHYQQEWSKVRRKYLRDILLNKFDDTGNELNY